MDARKRKLFDAALEGVDAEAVSRVRSAVIESERAGAGARFKAFVFDHLGPDFFRDEAVDALRPVRRADLARALTFAYGVRSRNVHVLEELPQEAWVLGDRADTVWLEGQNTVLSLEGLARLARHVVRTYVDRAPTELDEDFDWRKAIPGVIRMRAAPQYWIWQAQGFSREAGQRYLAGFAEQLVEVAAGREEAVPDMREVLEEIEKLVPATANSPERVAMVAIHALWHANLDPQFHRPGSEKFLDKHVEILGKVGMSAYVAWLVGDQAPDWSPDQWLELATDRLAKRARPKQFELPPAFDAALQATAAQSLADAGRLDEARERVRAAVEELPGNTRLIEWEAAFESGEPTELDMQALIQGLDPTASDGVGRG